MQQASQVPGGLWQQGVATGERVAGVGTARDLEGHAERGVAGARGGVAGVDDA